MQNDNGNEVEITTYDRLLRAWENSKELTLDFEKYSKRIEDDDEAIKVFKRFAEQEGAHASELRSMLLERQKNRGKI